MSKDNVTVRDYKDARGYYTGRGKQFTVMKGSKVRGRVTHGFIIGSQGLYDRIRTSLIDSGVLKADGKGHYFFTMDWTFDAPSQAASIVDGQSRSGPACWGPNDD